MFVALCSSFLFWADSKLYQASSDEGLDAESGLWRLKISFSLQYFYLRIIKENDRLVTWYVERYLV